MAYNVAQKLIDAHLVAGEMKPGRTLLGSDSHTPSAGSLGMLAIRAGSASRSRAYATRNDHPRR